MKPPPVLLFDAAGTLIKPAEPVGHTYAAHAALQGIHLPQDLLMAAFLSQWRETPPPLHPEGSPPEDDDAGWWHQLVGRVFTQALGEALPAPLLERLFNSLYHHYAKASAWHVFADARPALVALAQNHRLFVLSNFDRRLRTILAGHDLLPFFEQVILSSEVGAAKPHPRMFSTALALAGCPAHACLHVGDDPECDLAGAHAAGIPCFQVRRPERDLADLEQKVRSGEYSGLRKPLT